MEEVKITPTVTDRVLSEIYSLVKRLEQEKRELENIGDLGSAREREETMIYLSYVERILYRDHEVIEYCRGQIITRRDSDARILDYKDGRQEVAEELLNIMGEE